jgi:hypothetical protein
MSLDPSSNNRQSAANAPQTQPPEPESSIDAPTEEIAEMEEEVGDRDPTYIRTRTVFRYDERQLQGSNSVDRFRFRLLYAFGPKQRFGVSVLVPAIRADTPFGDARGAADIEIQANANVYFRPRFRTGAGIQATLQTASDRLLGGDTTTLKPSWDFAAVLSSRFELTGALYYKRSIHTTRGIPAKQFEPDITLNVQALTATWFVEWDSFYDFIPARYAHTMKVGVGRRFGGNRPWVVSPYYARGINDYARLSQYRSNAGLDLTWYLFAHR